MPSIAAPQTTLADEGAKPEPLDKLTAPPAWAGGSPVDLMGFFPDGSMRFPTLDLLAQAGEIRHFAPRTQLIREGEYGETMYIILAGRLRAYVSGDKGREVTLGTHGPGDYLGEMSLDSGPRSASVETIVHSACSLVSMDVLRRHMDAHPEFAQAMMARIIKRLRVATAKLGSMALQDNYQRLTVLLQSLAIQRPDGVLMIAERITQESLARDIGCSREMVSRLMKEMEAKGLISVVDRQIVLHEALAAP